MPLNQSSIFPVSRETLLNYDWVDIANATGYVLYDGWRCWTDEANTYSLTPSSDTPTLIGDLYEGTHSIYTTASQSNSATYVAALDIDFDTSEFQLPRTIEGVAIVRVPAYIADGTNSTNYVYAHVYIRKWDGSSETEIANKRTNNNNNVGQNTEFAFTLPITCTKTHFKKGDQLRVTVMIYAKDTTGVNHTVTMGHNPNDSTVTGFFSASNSRMTVAIPFKLDNI